LYRPVFQPKGEAGFGGREGEQWIANSENYMTQTVLIKIKLLWKSGN
jgi:hypothetical protein